MKKIIHTFPIRGIKVKLLGLLLFLTGSLQSCSDEESVSIQVSANTLYFNGSGGIQELLIQSPIEWAVTVAKGGDWCHYDRTDNFSTLSISVKKNPKEEERKTCLIFSSGNVTKRVDIYQKPSGHTSPTYPQVDSDLPLSSLTDEKGNIIPDFSNIGYMGSEQEIPDIKVVETIEAPASGDATRLIQEAIDRVAARSVGPDGFKGAVLLKKGRYNISGTLLLQSSGVVLRGEGENSETGTVLIASGTGKRALVRMEGTGVSTPNSTTALNIKDNYVPVGQFWVRVLNPTAFREGDNVTIYRPGTAQWISDIKMDQIPPRSDGGVVGQWDPVSYDLSYERRITHISNDTLHFDNPIMMAMETRYNRGAVFKSSFTGRISHCGIENMLMESEYISDEDKEHALYAIEFTKVEHSWARNITSKYFVNGLANLITGTRFVTVKDSKCLDPKSVLTGGRRYPFCMIQAQQCLVIDCEATEARHTCSTGTKGVGPNAFVKIKTRNTHGDVGPHQRWNVGTLYDSVDTDGQINVLDRGSMGSGQGWAGANQIFWNCIGSRICIQSPWDSAKNYGIGCKGTKYKGPYADRPEGIYIRENQPVIPASLFEAQLELRKRTGRLYHSNSH